MTEEAVQDEGAWQACIGAFLTIVPESSFYKRQPFTNTNWKRLLWFSRSLASCDIVAFHGSEHGCLPTARISKTNEVFWLSRHKNMKE